MAGKLYVIGMGPGSMEQMTPQAYHALRECDVIAGYTVYIDLLKDHFPGKEYLSTPMTREEERCRMALAASVSGRNTALVCSGDAGVYGMAGLVLELASDYPGAEVEVIPGITAASSGASAMIGDAPHASRTLAQSFTVTILVMQCTSGADSRTRESSSPNIKGPLSGCGEVCRGSCQRLSWSCILCRTLAFCSANSSTPAITAPPAVETRKGTM